MGRGQVVERKTSFFKHENSISISIRQYRKGEILPPLLNQYTQDNNVHIWAPGPAKPPCRLFNIYADMYKYQVLSINEKTEAPKPDTKTPKNQQVEKTRGTCTPDQGSGATLGVLGYASA